MDIGFWLLAAVILALVIGYFLSRRTKGIPDATLPAVDADPDNPRQTSGGVPPRAGGGPRPNVP